MSKHLTNDFLNELFKLCFYKKGIIEVLELYFKYQFIPKELGEYKKILKSVLIYYSLQLKVPTFGIISQEHFSDPKVQESLSNIKKAELVGVDIILKQLESFIKEVEFQLMFEKSADLYNGDKQLEAIEYCTIESERIHNFSIRKDTSYFIKVFEDFSKSQSNKYLKGDKSYYDKVPFGITPLDVATKGGIDITETVLWIMRSGVGKSTALKWTGMYACRMGYDVLHFQLEGTKEEAHDKYNQIWTAYDYSLLRSGNIYSESMAKFEDIVKKMYIRKKEIYVHAFEKFDESSMIDIRETTLDYKKIRGKFPDLIIIDSIDLCHPGDGIKYGIDTQSVKMKKENTAKRMKNMSVEFLTRVLTADQADGIPPTIWNDPEQVITRHNASGTKLLASSFSYIFTGNQTNDEYVNNMMRLYVDKFRNYKNVNPIYKIATAFDYGKFFDKKETIRQFSDE